MDEGIDELDASLCNCASNLTILAFKSLMTLSLSINDCFKDISSLLALIYLSLYLVTFLLEASNLLVNLDTLDSYLSIRVSTNEEFSSSSICLFKRYTSPGIF